MQFGDEAKSAESELPSKHLDTPSMAARKKESAVTFDDDDLLSALVGLAHTQQSKLQPIRSTYILDRMTRRPLAVGQVLAGELQGTSRAQISWTVSSGATPSARRTRMRQHLVQRNIKLYKVMGAIQ